MEGKFCSACAVLADDKRLASVRTAGSRPVDLASAPVRRLPFMRRAAFACCRGPDARKKFNEGTTMLMTPEPNKPLKYVFSSPGYPWNGVAGAELIHATLDPVRARAWLEEGAKGRLGRIFQRFSDPGESPPSLSEWSVWIRVWTSREPEPRPYVVLPPSATILARTIRQQPGDMWQRIREQLLWQPQTMDDAQKLIDRLAEGQRDLPFSTFYLWARVARWYEQHEHEPENPPVPNTWTDQLARECLRDRGFWDEYPNADDLVALDNWLTTNPLESNPALDELLARYTHWRTQNQGSRSTGATTMLPQEWVALARAWIEEFQGNPAYGRDLAWLAQTRNLAPSLERGKDPMTFRSLMMMALSELVNEGKIVPQSTGDRPWDTSYILSPGEIDAVGQTHNAVAASQVHPEHYEEASEETGSIGEGSEASSLDSRWVRLIDLWRQSFGSDAVSIERVLTAIRRDETLSPLLPEDPRDQRRYVRNVVIPRLPQLGIPVTVSRLYLTASRKSLYALSSENPAQDPGTYTPEQQAESAESMTQTAESRAPFHTDVGPQDIERFFQGWRRTFGQSQVRLTQLLTEGRQQGWILPLKVPEHFNPNKPHPLTLWLRERLNRPMGQYRIEKHSKGYILAMVSDHPETGDKRPPVSEFNTASQPAEPTVEDFTRPSTSSDENPAEMIERLKPSDPQSVFWRVLTLWVPLLKNVGPEWFAQWSGLDPRVYERIRHLWPVLVTSAAETNQEHRLAEENERLKRLLGDRELQLAEARDLLRKNGLL